MKIIKIVLGIVLVVLSSCGTTKTTKTSTISKEKVLAKEFGKTYKINVATDGIVVKKGEMSKEEIQKWPHMDIYRDSIPGMSLAKAYEFLQGREGETVIVAVIDSGIDIEHEDLKNVIWINKNEIPNNGIDDDKNGYIDDVYGWNFLGGEEGSSAPEQLEITRIVKKLRTQYGTEADRKKIIEQEGKGNKKATEQVAEITEKEYEYYLTLKKEVDLKREKAAGQKAYFGGLVNSINSIDKKIQSFTGKDVYTLEEMKNFKPENDNDKKGVQVVIKLLSSGIKLKDGVKELQGTVASFASKVDFRYNIDFNGRVTGDDVENIRDTKYGNKYVIGSKDIETHGTHVSGIICAERNNGAGMNGVAHNVALMSIRAVPSGDEYDKDVALGIRYAVDNGAKVINMSLGKSYSPHRAWVFDAIKYAESKDVLLVHAAGNDHKDIDVEDNFPNDSKDKIREFADNLLTVGSITRNFDERIVSSFSNYGKKNVDIFAPGSEIYSTFPKDIYKLSQGTSMASPEVAGVAALIRSYYPSLTASQVKHIIIDSGIEMNQVVKLPIAQGSKTKMVKFDTLSISGKILNAYNALVMADEMVNGK
ncbi:MAG: S8 family peptidase [Flavobacteriaceae bacterium]|nr:S8 family peptidase [Flavobacteriaceae bacterium]